MVKKIAQYSWFIREKNIHSSKETFNIWFPDSATMTWTVYTYFVEILTVWLVCLHIHWFLVIWCFYRDYDLSIDFLCLLCSMYMLKFFHFHFSYINKSFELNIKENCILTTCCYSQTYISLIFLSIYFMIDKSFGKVLR